MNASGPRVPHEVTSGQAHPPRPTRKPRDPESGRDQDGSRSLASEGATCEAGPRPQDRDGPGALGSTAQCHHHDSDAQQIYRLGTVPTASAGQPECQLGDET